MRILTGAVSLPIEQPVIIDRPWPISKTRIRALAVAAIISAGLAFRLLALGAYGYSQDEMNKVNAIAEYRRMNFAANAEHPMLMKLTMWASLDIATAWNRVATPLTLPTLSEEAALRLPNVLVGAATTIVVFLLASVLFDKTVGVVGAALWSLDVNATAINRIGKEDTFLVFFLLLAIWLYERAKQIGATEPLGAQRWYAASGASFGLMLASKYMPHFIGIYALFNTITDRHPGANRPHRIRFYGALALAFVIANAAVLLPATWTYVPQYVQGQMLEHHGYLYTGHLYLTNVPVSPIGVPATYYLRYLATKVPMAVLVAAAVGLVELVRRRRERGFILLRVLLVFVLVPYSLMAAKFIRYLLPLFVVIDVTAAVGLVAGVRWLLRKQWLSRATRVSVACAAYIVSIGALLAAEASAAPFYASFQNVVGEHLASPGATFPEETYDYGVREAVQQIATVAAPGAVIVSDAPGVVAHYLAHTRRTDLIARSLSADGIPLTSRESWILVQDEHLSFENEAIVAELRRRSAPVQEIQAGGARAVQVFRVAGGDR